MSVGSEALRAAMAVRAAHRCEYCHLPTRGQVATFPLDHVTPENEGGLTVPENLALACPCCNGHKWKYTTGVDPVSGAASRLFNPRVDGWSDHFAWSDREPGLLEGKTVIGRATIARLRINDPLLVSTRQLLGQLGLFHEVMGNPSPPTT